MVTALRNSRLLFCVLCCAVACGQPQQTDRAVRHHTVPVQQDSDASSFLDQAEPLLAKGDYSAAEPILRKATSKDPKSYAAWYDLGYAEQELGRTAEAISDYKRSVELDPKVFETNLNLGVALASSGERDEAAKYLKAATQLQPLNQPEKSKEHAWVALGKLELSSDPPAAEHAFLEAAKLLPQDPEPHLQLGGMYETANKLDEAKRQYQETLTNASNESRAQALRGLVNIAISSQQYREAESNVRQYLAVAPSDSQAHLLLGRLLVAQGNKEEALGQLNAVGDLNDRASLQEKADLLSQLHRDTEALPIYKQLVDQNANDARLRYDYGVALMHQRQFAPAQEQLLAAVKLNPNMANAYGDLAIVASENQQYALTLKALEIRTKLLGDNPGTYFLRATAFDHLRHFPEATQNYRQFLAVAGGKYPDEEWKARHRLIAIQNLK